MEVFHGGSDFAWENVGKLLNAQSGYLVSALGFERVSRNTTKTFVKSVRILNWCKAEPLFPNLPILSKLFQLFRNL
jgi:hypothetical protein